MRVAIIGAGMAGLAAAERLADAGLSPVLFDKGRGPGGRVATRRVDMAAVDAPDGDGPLAFDHGAQYMTVRDPGFAARVACSATTEDVAPWPAAGANAWVGTPGMNAPVKAMAATQDVRWGTRVDALARDADRWRLIGQGLAEDPFDAVLTALPAEQTVPLLRDWDPVIADLAAATPSAPCWTLIAAFAEFLPLPDIVRDRDIIGWATRDGAKPGRVRRETWVVQANPAWSLAHLEETPDRIVPALLAAFGTDTGTVLPTPVYAAAHRWRYARSGRTDRSHVWNPALRLGACGDWLIGPRVEAAWMSGDAAGTIMAKALSYS